MTPDKTLTCGLYIPTALSGVETRALREFARDRYMIEAGALLGYSTLQMAEVAREVISIDKHEGYGASTLRRYMMNLDLAGAVGKKVVPIVTDCITGLGHLGAARYKLSRYFLDLTGERDLTLRALNAIPEGHLVAVHDFGRVNCPGVKQAIRSLNCEIITVVDTLAFVRR